MGIQAFHSFLIYAIINAITPGPGNLLSLNTIVSVGWKKGKNLLFGVFAGYYVVQILCALLVYGLDQFLSPIMSVMKYIGAAYILWLVIHIVRSKPDLTGTNSKSSFWTGFVLQFVNVKIYMFGITALTGYVLPYYSSLNILLLFEIVIATIGTLATLTWAVFGTLFQKIYVKHYRIINIILALALVECAISLLML
ncbi:MAG: LysE family transporter [Eubacteriales bacterium]|jgi:cysteine/O-acetylserine efflux protein|nr:LysE family transporter [Eubacteriales bacterium]